MSDKLSSEQYRRIKRWEKKMVLFFTVAMIFGVTAISVSSVLNWSVHANRALVAVFVLFLAIPGALLQFSEKCPRCEHRLGFQTRLVLPVRCKKCGVSYQKPDENA